VAIDQMNGLPTCTLILKQLVQYFRDMFMNMDMNVYMNMHMLLQLLLNMAVTSSWCMNAAVIINIAKVSQ